ncbi:MAG: phosphate acetyltransferase [Eubacteriales bacterium]|nr:phosphate acetyltransferase [Eubacteriales bacterium]
MSNFLDAIVTRAKADIQTIVLPEGNDIRTIHAADIILKNGYANLIILGDEAEISKLSEGKDISGAKIINPLTAKNRLDYADKLYEMRKAKGMTQQQALDLISNPLYYGVMMVKNQEADGMVAGACNSTSNVLRPSLQILKTAPDSKLVSSFFVMVVPDCEYGENGTFVFADCGLNINPNAAEVSEIALASAKSFKSLVNAQPKVAMLSFSTYCSAKDPLVEKMQEATKLAKEKNPELIIDGELQLDAAIIPSVNKAKAPGSCLGGEANVLVFPDLNAGNIGYKIAQRLAKAEAYGPITQGIAKPVNDLSRGCSAEDIAGVVAITCVQAQNN